uniref:Uncharacterized protein n=1 Tax=Glossina austeni TaxID=7395 RepID=A0A1A9UVK7_GLOAU
MSTLPLLISVYKLTCSRSSVSFSQALPGENSPAATTETSTPRGRISCRKQAAKLSTAACVAHCMPRTGAGTLLRPLSNACNMQKQKKVCKTNCQSIFDPTRNQQALVESVQKSDVKNTIRPFALRNNGNINCVKRATPSHMRNKDYLSWLTIKYHIPTNTCLSYEKCKIKLLQFIDDDIDDTARRATPCRYFSSLEYLHFHNFSESGVAYGNALHLQKG